MRHLVTGLLFMLLFGIIELTAQESYSAVSLSTPAEAAITLADTTTERTLYYGAVPVNRTNKPVLVFVHGFTGSAERWFSKENNMYGLAYQQDYRTAFVSMTGHEGYLVNGKILGAMLKDITDHYGVNDVVVVAHSNGGKATEAAMFLEDKSQLVERVITLGTPFRGTKLADFASSSSFKWLADLVGFGGQGAVTSTTYYMDGVARPMLDNEPDNQPEKFINFGAWGYNKGTTSANALTATGGVYLNFFGGNHRKGGNDGVTPYYSSTRPGGSQEWPGCFRSWRTSKCHKASRVDHFDIGSGAIVWDVIEPYFYVNKKSRIAPTNDLQQEPINTIHSNFEIISTLDGHQEGFTVGADAGKVTIQLWHPNSSSFTIVNEQTQKEYRPTQQSSSRSQSTNSSISFENLEEGTYSIQSSGHQFAALISYEQGPELIYDNSQLRYEDGKSVVLEVELAGTTELAKLTGTVVLQSDIAGKSVQEQAYLVQFQHQGAGKYQYTMPQGLQEGIYNLTVNAEGISFRRNIVGGFVVIGDKENLSVEAPQPMLELLTYPNPVISQATITFDLLDNTNAQLSVYDVYGKVVKQQDISTLALGHHSIILNLAQLSDGMYFIELKNGQQKVTQSLLKIH